jgi:hypothetical protein
VFFLAAAWVVVFLAAARHWRANRMPNEALAIAGGLIGKPSVVAGWQKPVEYTRCRAVLLMRAKL